MRTPFLRNKGTLFAKQTVLDKLSPKNLNCGEGLDSTETASSPTIKSFDRTFQKFAGGGRSPQEATVLICSTLDWYCNTDGRLMPSPKIRQIKDGKSRLF
jgi:hypothetical protein